MRQNLNSLKTVYENDFIISWVDNTLYKLFEEKPSSRWDCHYWQPKYDALLEDLSKHHMLVPLSDYISSIEQGDVPRKARGDKYVKKGIIFLNVVDIVSTGIAWVNCKRIIDSHYKRIQRAEPEIGDLIFVRSGKGSIGKSAVFIGIHNEQKIGISGHLNTVRLEKINPYYVEVFLKSFFGQLQIERFESGTSQQTDFRQESFAAVKIPILKDSIQSTIESEYKKMASCHDKAMQARLKGNDSGYKKNMEIAESLLKELIIKTEAVIRGERKDIN